MVRAALKAVRRRKGATQRQAAPLRLGQALDPNVGKGFTLQALLAACSADLQGLRDAALLSLGYDAGLRVSELVAVPEQHIDTQSDGTATLFIPRSKTDQEQQGAWAWLSPDTMRRVGAWLEASGIREGPLFRRVGIDRRRAKAEVAPIAYEAIPGNTRYWREKMEGRPAEAARTTYSIGKEQLTRQGVNAIYRRIAITAFDQGHVAMSAAKVASAVQALSTHSLRVGLTQDLFAAGEDGVDMPKHCAGVRRRPRCAMGESSRHEAMLLLGFFPEFAVERWKRFMSDDDINPHPREPALNDRMAVTFAELSDDELREFASVLKQVTLDHLPPEDE